MRTPPPTSAGHILAVLRAEGPLTRQELQDRIGLSRATMVERLDVLQRHRLVRQTGLRASNGGRPAQVLAADDTGRTALVADVGQRHATIAVVDLRGDVFAQLHRPLPVGHLPEETLSHLLHTGRALLAETGRADSLCAVGLSVPGQIDHERGTTIAPPSMREWTGLPLRDRFTDALSVPVFLENDANALAFGAYCELGRPDAALVGVKVGTGIGAGLVISGRTHRGETASAGEIGHIRIEGNDQRCDCGRRGCVSAIASGQAVIRQLRPTGVRSAEDVVRRVRAGNIEAIRVTAAAGRLVGTVLATVVTIVNPRYLRVGGAIGVLPPFLDSLRDAVRANAQTTALEGVSVDACRLGVNTTLTGVAGLVADEMLAPAAVDALVHA
ncbi:ROK family transcriptional regulator [Amycolatopsis sacchari]|uniref:Sugar kinase of the NBD/HSP70 family, may contain an N-terminal HTH domain n=1 Tax=Amycolatopsis sacchari TaxID=115433 RepID=A0A1I3YY13_9PSEU|nr:ROK family transcriptional regulator [Amycolatopsis sacchari]SFK36764.1 Sugar kinase of the NBD/HSP70 family, may contain an N-terminal HTH domain [Amycolatopsis sacchari]